MSKKTLWIGLGHRKGTGKDTIATMLRDAFYRADGPWVTDGANLIITPFARELKQMAERIFACRGLKHYSYYEANRELKESPLPGLTVTPRDIYIKLGMVIRELDPQYWRDFIMEDKWYTGQIVVIPDVRFQNEADEIKRRGGLLVNVVRDTGLPSDAADDALEGYDGWDMHVANEGDKDQLANLVRTTLLPKVMDKWLALRRTQQC